MLTIIPKGLRIIAGGCRYTLNDGRSILKYCDECNTEGKTCELESGARKLAETRARRDSSSSKSANPRFNW